MASSPKAPADPIDARLVRKLADILTETGLSEIEVEHGGLKIRVAKQLAAVHHVTAHAPVAHARLNIPPHAARHVEVKEQAVPFPMNLTGLMAHMHVRGRAFKFEVMPPGGGEPEVLLDIPRYDFNWQLRYEYKSPKLIPQGSTMKITAVFDNSAGNKANPDPTKRVRWGSQTVDEMMIGYVEYFRPL